MKRLSIQIIIFLFALAFFFHPSALAETSKVITLNDGSVIKGRVLSLQGGVYLVDSDLLGEINIPEEEVVSITTAAKTSMIGERPTAAEISVEAKTLTPGPLEPISPQAFPGTPQAGELREGVQQIQNQLLADPEIMQEIQDIFTDPELMSVMEDEDFLSAVFSMDPERIQQNPRTSSLMNHPKMQKLMQKIAQKLNAPSP